MRDQEFYDQLAKSAVKIKFEFKKISASGKRLMDERAKKLEELEKFNRFISDVENVKEK